MVDASGRATTRNPVYYDLYVGDGTKRRFLATNATGALGQFVSTTDAHGVTSAPADMGVDIKIIFDIAFKGALLSSLSPAGNAEPF